MSQYIVEVKNHVAEVFDTCLFLASDMARNITGTRSLADDGLSKGLLSYGRTQAVDKN